MTDLLKKTGIWFGIALVVYLLLFFFLDMPIDRWVYANLMETWVFQAGTYISYLADGSFIRLAIALCFILIIIVDPGIKKHWTRVLLYICICCAIAITIGDGLKFLLARHRPVMFFEQELYGLQFFSGEWETNSSPSGHSIRAFTILTALSLLYRRYAALFITLAILIGISRVIVTAHYPSDVVFGAFIGIFTALWVYRYFFKKYTAPAG